MDAAKRIQIVGEKLPISSYYNIGASEKTASGELDKEASNQILKDLMTTFDTGELPEKTAGEGKSEEEKKKEEEAKAKKEEEKAKAEKSKETTAGDLVVENEMTRKAAAYYDLGTMIAHEKLADMLFENNLVDAKVANVVSLYVSSHMDALVKQAAEEASSLIQLPDASEGGSIADNLFKSASSPSIAADQHQGNAIFFGTMGKAAAHGFVDAMTQFNEMAPEEASGYLAKSASELPAEFIKAAGEIHSTEVQ